MPFVSLNGTRFREGETLHAVYGATEAGHLEAKEVAVVLRHLARSYNLEAA